MFAPTLMHLCSRESLLHKVELATPVAIGAAGSMVTY